MSLWRTLFRIPWHIIALSLLLVAIGAMALYSASEGSWQPWAGRHAMRGAFGVGVVLVMAFVDFKILHRLSYFMLIAAIAEKQRALVVLDDPWMPEQVRFLNPVSRHQWCRDEYRVGMRTM